MQFAAVCASAVTQNELAFIHIAPASLRKHRERAVLSWLQASASNAGRPAPLQRVTARSNGLQTFAPLTSSSRKRADRPGLHRPPSSTRNEAAFDLIPARGRPGAPPPSSPPLAEPARRKRFHPDHSARRTTDEPGTDRRRTLLVHPVVAWPRAPSVKNAKLLVPILRDGSRKPETHSKVLAKIAHFHTPSPGQDNPPDRPDRTSPIT